ncbi:MAG TPA: phosphatidate cytidylyltransferase [Firmicutes bacterium]|nr:phosphatidate cytidylyltransferase [Bacillota bacterium]
MEKLGRRVATSVVFVVLFLLALFHPWLAPHLAFLMVGGAITLGLWELYDLVERRGVRVWRICGVTTGWLLALAGYVRILGYEGLSLEFVAILFLFFSTFSVQLRRGISGAVPTVMGTFFGVVYVAAPMTAILWIYNLSGGRWLLLFLFLVTCLNDTGAYLIGSKFGRLPLSPRISPRKTIEGSLGGLFCGVAGAFLLGWLMQWGSPVNYFYWAPADKTVYGQAFILAVLLSVVGQIGDLSESMLKRDAGVKDSGSSLTGHGGMLDMADSLLFTVPFTFLYAKTVLNL